MTSNAFIGFLLVGSFSRFWISLRAKARVVLQLCSAKKIEQGAEIQAKAKEMPCSLPLWKVYGGRNAQAFFR